MKSKTLRSFALTFLYSIWLPFAVLALSILRFGVDGWIDFEDLLNRLHQLLLLFVWTWPCGLPLTIAMQKIYRRNKPAAYVTGIILIPVSALFATTGGLFGPIGVALYSAVASIPAWITLGLMVLIKWCRTRKLARLESNLDD